MPESTIAVLIHGLHVETPGWEKIVWGDPQNGLYGRAIKGIELAYLKGASFVFWGTGASEKNGQKESEYTFRHALERLEELPFLANDDIDDLRYELELVSYLDTTTQNTGQEIRLALTECTQRGIEELYLVSSPTHVVRCLRDALKVLHEETGNPGKLRVYATASDVSFVGTFPSEVVIFEPPHRIDRPSHAVHKHVGDIFKVPSDNIPAFLADFDALITKHGG